VAHYPASHVAGMWGKGSCTAHSTSSLSTSIITSNIHHAMSKTVVIVLLVALVALSFAPQVAAFGAGRSQLLLIDSYGLKVS
jgi:hypothetical protein